MPQYRGIVPNSHSHSPQMMTGEGLSLAGGSYSLPRAMKTAAHAARISDLEGEGFGRGTQRKVLAGAKKAARVGEQLVNQFGTDDQRRKVGQARAVVDAIDGGAFGRGTQKKIYAGATKAAKVGERLVNAFGSDDQKRKVGQARAVVDTINGSGIPASHLRAMAAQKM